MVFSYNKNKKPPRPECELYISNPSEFNRSQTVKAFADTGSDMTMIPQSVIDKLGNVMQGEVKCRTLNGISKETTYIVNIKIGNDDFILREVVGIANKKAIVGRDIINKNKASFHASNNSWRLNCSGNCKPTLS